MEEWEDYGTEKHHTIDLLWMFANWRHVPGIPGWNGFMETLTKNQEDFHVSHVLYLPFINNTASDMNTIYTTLNCAITSAKDHNQNSCIVTFDQPLYFKAREIVAASETGSDLSGVIVRLGGFHTLMSFLGCIGYIMDGSGLKELLSTIYAPKSVDKLLDGHAYARSVRGHTLVRSAISKFIFDDIQMDEEVKDFYYGFINDILSGSQSLENINATPTIFQPLTEGFHQKIEEFRSRGPTAKLWVQYLDMVSIVHDYIRAERLGNWNGHLTAVKKMLPYFHAAGHFLYAKSAQLYLQDMMELEKKMDVQEFDLFQKGFFTVRRRNKFNCGTWTDMTIEQTVMKDMKVEGGVSHGRGTEESVLTKWVNGMHAMNVICEGIEDFCNLTMNSFEQHTDSRGARITRDAIDIQKLLDWLSLHNPFPLLDSIISIATGIVGDEKINCHNAREIGLSSLKNIIGQNFGELKFKRSRRVLPISTIKNSLKIHNCKVAIDPLLLFQRICLNKKFEENLQEYLQYELSPYPLSLFDHAGMRKTSATKLYTLAKSTDVAIERENVTYVIDGNFLLNTVLWQKNDDVSTILGYYTNYLRSQYGADVVVVFDGDSDNCMNVRSMGEAQRMGANSTSVEYHFDVMESIPVSREQFFNNSKNKKKFIELLVAQLTSCNIICKQAQTDAYVLIIDTAVEASKNKMAIVVGEDVDLLVIMSGRAQGNDRILFQKIGKGRDPTVMYSANCFDCLPAGQRHILLLHAITGCETTSAFYNKGKIQVMKMFEKRPDLQLCAEAFKEENCSPNTIIANGIKIILAIYDAAPTQHSIDNYRYHSFAKSTRLLTPVKLSSLIPTSAAAQQHILRSYYQVQTWLGKNIDPQQWGWTLKNNMLIPIESLLPPAPDVLLDTVFCNCTRGCGNNCGCRKIGLQCTAACGHCHGQACLNVISDSIETTVTEIDNDIHPIDILETNMDMTGDDQFN